VGTARQYCGRLGKVENCQTGVFVSAAKPAGRPLLEHQICLPEERARREELHVPPDFDVIGPHDLLTLP
jgi:SRSO17 transposase